MQTPETRVYTRAQKLLLIAALCIGVVWDFGWQHGANWCYGLFWCVYLLVFYLFNWEALKANRLCWALAAAAVALCVRFGWGQPRPLYTLTLVAIPLLLMTHAVFATVDIPVRREGAAVWLVFRGFFVRPFTALPDAFRAFASLFTRRGEGRIKRVLLGLAIGLPLTAIVLALLISADDMMGELLGGWLKRLPDGSFIPHLINTLVAALLFYSFLFNARWGKRETVPAREKLQAPQTTPIVVLALLLVVYALFGYVQFRYLFGGRLPDELSYAIYARHGFFELVVVALINFSAYTAINALCREGGALRVLQCLILLANAMLIASAMLRLFMYIGAYGLTIMRILPLWFMIWLSALDVLAVVRLFKTNFPLLRVAALTLIAWFVALNMPAWRQLL